MMEKVNKHSLVYDTGYNNALSDIKTIINDVVKTNKCYNVADLATAFDSIISITHMDKKEIEAWVGLIINKRKPSKRDEEIEALLKKLFDLI
jgi:hypothetical protein